MPFGIPQGGSVNTADIGQGLIGGATSALQRMMAMEDERRKAAAVRQAAIDKMRMDTAQANALSRQGSPGEVMSVFEHLIKPAGQQKADEGIMDDLMTDNPALMGKGRPGELPKTPDMSRMKPGEMRMGPASRTPLSTGDVPYGGGMGIPQSARPLREVQATRLLPMTNKSMGRDPSTYGRGSGGAKQRLPYDIARNVLTDFAKSLNITEDVLRDQLRTNPQTRTRLTQNVRSAIKSLKLPDPTPQEMQDIINAIVGQAGM